MSWAPWAAEERRKDFRSAHQRALRLRKDVTASEKRAWKLLRDINREGANFRRQAHVGGLVYDFADLSRRILVELDGGVHKLAATREADHKKEMAAIMHGYRVVRITNAEVWSNPDVAIDKLRAAIARVPPPIGGRVGRGGVRNWAHRRRSARSLAANLEGPLPLPPPRGEGEAAP